MSLPSFLQRKANPPAPRRASAAAGPADDSGPVQQARTRARRRLIGAVVLLGLGIVGFPLLFETQPRPIAVDIPIETPRKDSGSAAPVVVPVPAPAPAPRASAPVVAAAPAEEFIEPAPAAAKSPPAPVAASAPVPKPPAADDGQRAKALLDDKPASAAGEARFVVQVGAYTDAVALREARQKVEKLGLKTYTQVVETDAGKRTRVRVGPFATREEADRTGAKLKAAGLPAAILTL